MSGFNVYDVRDDGTVHVAALVYHPEEGAFREGGVPKHVGWSGDRVA